MIKSRMITLLLIIFIGCDVANSTKSANNSDSNNNIISNNGNNDAVFDCDDCLTENEVLLKKLGYDVEEFANCTDLCGLVPGEDTPEKKQCDLDCIADRLEAAQSVCLEDNFCDVLIVMEEKQDQEQEEIE